MNEFIKKEEVLKIFDDLKSKSKSFIEYERLNEMQSMIMNLKSNSEEQINIFADKLKVKIQETSEIYCKEYCLPKRSLYLDDVMDDIDEILKEMLQEYKEQKEVLEQIKHPIGKDTYDNSMWC